MIYRIVRNGNGDWGIQHRRLFFFWKDTTHPYSTMYIRGYPIKQHVLDILEELKKYDKSKKRYSEEAFARKELERS